MSTNGNPNKRRRLDATSALSRPFKSPLRRPAPEAASDSTPSKPKSTPPQNDTPSVSQGDQPNKNQDKSVNLSNSPSVNASPRVPRTPGLRPPRKSLMVDPELLDLRKQQRLLQSRIATMRTDLDNVRQAQRIESAGKEGELEALIVKWRLVSQEAADEAFSNAQERVNRMGGMTAWNERTKRDAVQWDFEEPQPHNDEADLDADVLEDIAQAKKKQEEEADQEFTMEYMLRTLQIEHKLIGFDPATGNWIRDI
ncbi:hypothetical protein N7493_001807 [Penicillium malachiteum]|uniref:Swi5-dependent recombination DNA repair protein 1 n=1 Tax=Penicillium malachiteum TaxID=1324776 RepID=A0AAD6HUW4_9EURO|nr:hypothetical protein N7493_001807 [Penicillium malachiteum]